VGPRAGLDDMEKGIFLTLPRPESVIAFIYDILSLYERFYTQILEYLCNLRSRCYVDYISLSQWIHTTSFERTHYLGSLGLDGEGVYLSHAEG
jgi:hypothetical protein